jgi:hypothetical protein
MARRFAGDALSIYVKINADSESYDCRVVAHKYSSCRGTAAAYPVTVGAPASGFGLGIAYDSPVAYDRIAKSALAFAQDHECNPDTCAEFRSASVDEVTRENLWRRF